MHMRVPFNHLFVVKVLAPEIYFGTRYTAKSDVFVRTTNIVFLIKFKSIGILLWECVYRCIFQKYQRPYAVVSVVLKLL